MGRCGLGTSGSGQELMAGSCEHGSGLTGVMKGGKFLDFTSDSL
jgi:hypothetical protein